MADVALALRSKVKSSPTKSSEQSNSPVKLPPTSATGKTRKFAQYQRIQYPPPNLAGRHPVLGRHHCQSPKKICKNSSDARNPSRSCSNESSSKFHAARVKTVIPIEKRNWRRTPCAERTSKVSYENSSRLEKPTTKTFIETS